jgi:hypothetical protein
MTPVLLPVGRRRCNGWLAPGSLGRLQHFSSPDVQVSLLKCWPFAMGRDSRPMANGQDSCMETCMMTRKTRSIAAVMFAAALAASSAAMAQYYPGYGGGGGYEDDNGYRGGGGYGGRPRYDPGPGEYYEQRPRRARLGNICVTSRGNCDAGFAAPRNTPCRCYLPGFGEKRGAIGY